jgi:hypothetical protein
MTFSESITPMGPELDDLMTHGNERRLTDSPPAAVRDELRTRRDPQSAALLLLSGSGGDVLLADPSTDTDRVGITTDTG